MLWRRVWGVVHFGSHCCMWQLLLLLLVSPGVCDSLFLDCGKGGGCTPWVHEQQRAAVPSRSMPLALWMLSAGDGGAMRNWGSGKGEWCTHAQLAFSQAAHVVDLAGYR
mmetsp:Transcript_59165/g.105155  ORF Transcript_59165/g.105155 Transcript_59165/m.105155 type:complete len:109 (-) Transcript_59165:96-422(-)